MAGRHIKVCPRCGSTDITIPGAGMDLKMTVPDSCRDCGNRGTFPEIEESELAYFRKELKRA